MSKVPSVKPLIPLVTFIILFHSNIAWAYLLDDTVLEYRFKADKLQSEGKFDQAIVYYQKAIGIDKHCLAAYNGLALCFEKKGEFCEAKDWYLRALEVNFTYAAAHYNLALLYEKYGEIDKAIFHWKQRLRLGHPADPATINTRAKLEKYAPDELQEEDARELEKRIMQQKAKSSLDKILGRNKYKTREEKIQEHYLEGMQLYQKGDFRQAAECFQRMIDVLPISN